MCLHAHIANTSVQPILIAVALLHWLDSTAVKAMDFFFFLSAAVREHP